MTRGNQERTRKPATAARMYDYYLGGIHSFPADQEAAEAVIARLPCVPAVAQTHQAFLTRAVGFLIQAGVRQFFDIGAGLPGQGSVQQLTAAAADVRAVFVDIDPCAVADTLELLDDATWAAAVRGDLRTPRSILDHPKARRLLDLTRPVGVLLTAVLPFVPDDRQAYDAVSQLVSALPAGSYVAISHGAAETFPPDSEACKAVAGVYQRYTTTPVLARDRVSVERFFTGLQLVAPGVVCAHQWHPDPSRPVPMAVADVPALSGLWVGVGRSHAS